MNEFDITTNGWQNPPAEAVAYDVVSVQSMVVYGSVGNSVALPTLIKHGLRTCVVPTVILSNTPHYPSCYGGEIPREWFQGYLRGFQERGAAAKLRAVLSGYLGSAQKAEDLAHWLGELREINPAALVVVDPVMGDEDSGYYVPPEIMPFYRDRLLPLATGITPNKFELGCLYGVPVESQEEMIAAARSLMQGALQWVVVTSASTLREDSIEVLCVTRDEAMAISHTRYPLTPKGTGDLFGAELTAQLLAGATLTAGVERACQRIEQAILQMQANGNSELLV